MRNAVSEKCDARLRLFDATGSKDVQFVLNQVSRHWSSCLFRPSTPLVWSLMMTAAGISSWRQNCLQSWKVCLRFTKIWCLQNCLAWRNNSMYKSLLVLPPTNMPKKESICCFHGCNAINQSLKKFSCVPYSLQDFDQFVAIPLVLVARNLVWSNLINFWIVQGDG